MKVKKLIEMLSKQNWNSEVRLDFREKKDCKIADDSINIKDKTESIKSITSYNESQSSRGVITLNVRGLL